MKFKNLIIILGLIILSWCSFINENKIKESENIDVETFLETQTNTWEISKEEIIIETDEIKEDMVEEINIIETEKEKIEEIKVVEESLDESEIEAQELEDELKKLIDILFEVSN